MKKIFSYLAIAAICAGFAACDEVEEGGAGPQTNPSEPTMEQNGIGVELNKATAEAVSLADYSSVEGASLVPMLNVVKLENFPQGYTLGGYMYLADNEEMTDAKALPLVFTDNELCVRVQDWEDAHIALYTKNPKKVDSYVDFELLAINGNSVVRLGDARYAYHKLEVTPLPAANPIENKYFMIVGGNKVEMNATNPDNVYDPPTFSAVVEVPEDTPVKVSFESESGVKFGLGESEGKLAVDGGDITISTPGPQKVTINLETLTYDYALAIECLYAYTSVPTLGNALPTNDYVNYRGFAGITQLSFMLANEKKAVPSMKWGAAVDGDEIIPGFIELSSTHRIPVEEKGCYYLKVNLSSLAYEAIHIQSFGLIGEFNEWGGDAVLTPDSKFTKWTGEVTIAQGSLFKIRTNGSWDDPNPNLGGASLDNLVEHGDNLIWPVETGTYTVTLDLTKLPYSLTYVKK